MAYASEPFRMTVEPRQQAFNLSANEGQQRVESSRSPDRKDAVRCLLALNDRLRAHSRPIERRSSTAGQAETLNSIIRHVSERNSHSKVRCREKVTGRSRRDFSPGEHRDVPFVAGTASASTAPSGLDRSDINLSHPHHGFERAEPQLDQDR
ncbi:hypothetical protein PA01_19085 [Azoarcus sp. PA01]|nr:hypothetical protein PA01_19085 [Azoarcus sp. PA01]